MAAEGPRHPRNITTEDSPSGSREYHSESEGTNDELVDKKIRNLIAKEVAKAFQATIPQLVDQIKVTIQEEISSLNHENVVKTSEINSENDEPLEDRELKRIPYTNFVACKPPEYRGEINPLSSHRWISEMETAFDTSDCHPTQEVPFSVTFLKSRAKDWWDAIRKEKGRNYAKELLWDQFKQMFLEQYCPQVAIDRVQEEFMNMRQGNDSVDTITGKFYDKAQFCPELLRTERMWITRYHAMLNADYRALISPTLCNSLNDVINRAREIERENQRSVIRGEKRKEEGSSTHPKRQKFVATPKRDVPRGEMYDCKICNRKHRGICYMDKSQCSRCGKPGHSGAQCRDHPPICFNCYKSGHMKKDCPALNMGGQQVRPKNRMIRETGKEEAPKPRGRAFQITADEAKRTPDVVTGIS